MILKYVACWPQTRRALTGSYSYPPPRTQERCLREFWDFNEHTLEVLQQDALPAEAAVREFADWWSGILADPALSNAYLVSDNPQYDIAWINHALATHGHDMNLARRGAGKRRRFMPPVDLRSFASGMPVSLLPEGRALKYEFIPTAWGSARNIIRNVLGMECPVHKTHSPDADAYVIAWQFVHLLSLLATDAYALQSTGTTSVLAATSPPHGMHASSASSYVSGPASSGAGHAPSSSPVADANEAEDSSTAESPRAYSTPTRGRAALRRGGGGAPASSLVPHHEATEPAPSMQLPPAGVAGALPS